MVTKSYCFCFIVKQSLLCQRNAWLPGSIPLTPTKPITNELLGSFAGRTQGTGVL